MKKRNWCSPLVLTAAMLLTATVAFADRQVSHQFHSEVSSGNVKRVVIDIPTGSIRLRNGAADSIRVFGTAHRGYDDWPEREQKIVDDTSAEVYVSQDEAVVRRHFGADAQGWRAQRFTSFDLTIEVPRGTALEFETSYGSVDINGSFGDIDVALRAGDVNVSIPRADVRNLNASCRLGELTTNFGEEIVQRQGVLPGTTNFYNADGRAKVHVHVIAGNANVTLTK